MDNSTTQRKRLVDLLLTRSPEVIVNMLEGSGFHAVRITWSDSSGGTRFHVLPIVYFGKLIESGGVDRPCISMAQAGLGMVFSGLAPGFSPMGENDYVIDLRTVRVCSYAPGHLSFMGGFEHKRPIVERGKTEATREIALCPRSALKRVVREAKSESGVDFLVGFEIEFTLLESLEPMTPVNSYGWSMTRATSSGSVENAVLEEIARCLKADEIELQMYHAEAAPGQYEIVTGPMSPVEAVDALIATRETIYNITKAHNLHATLAPKVFKNQPGNGAHVHISLKSPSSSPDPESMTPHEKSFLSSVLTHLPALSFVTLPISASYTRVGDAVWAGGSWVCWGTDNREAPIRLCAATNPKSRNFEFRTMDGVANPYLAMAAILGVGHQGIKNGASLDEMKECGGLDKDGKPRKCAFELTEEERRENGITKRVPLSLDVARAAFEDDEAMKGIFGKEMVTAILSISKKMDESLRTGMGDEADLKFLVETF